MARLQTAVRDASPGHGEGRSNAWYAFWNSVVRFDAAKISPWLASRNTAGVVLPLAIAVATGHLHAGIAIATGALNVSYSDSHEPYVRRGRKMVAASVLVALGVFLGTLSGLHPLLSILTATVWALTAGMFVALSSTAGDLGAISLVTLLVYSAVPLDPRQAALAGFLAFSGGLIQTILALAGWPLLRYRPESRALGALYAGLAAAARSAMESPIRAAEAPPASQQSTNAQSALATLDHSVEGERLRSLLIQAERMRLGVVTLARLDLRMERESVDGSLRARVSRYFAVTADVLAMIAGSLHEGAAVSPQADFLDLLDRFPDELRDAAAPDGSSAALLRDARFQMDALNGQLRAAAELARNVSPTGSVAFERHEVAAPWKLRLAGTVATLRANWSLDSAACRHAIRLAACVAIGDGIARGFGLTRFYWLPMTIAIVLKPDFGATFSRGVLRLLGTLAGLGLATALFHLLPESLGVEVALIGGLMFALRCYGPANYGIFVTAVTALVVLLIAMTGTSPKEVMIARGLNTLAGGAIALVAYWLFPTWERNQVRAALARLLDRYRVYFRAIREGYANPGAISGAAATHELDQARLRSRLARSNLEASVARVEAEPQTPIASIKLLNGILASSHRMVHAFMAMEAGLATSAPVPVREAFLPFANDVELTLYYLASALRGSPMDRHALPDLREDHHALVHAAVTGAQDLYALVNVETDRVTNSLNTLSEELFEWMDVAD